MNGGGCELPGSVNIHATQYELLASRRPTMLRRATGLIARFGSVAVDAHADVARRHGHGLRSWRPRRLLETTAKSGHDGADLARRVEAWRRRRPTWSGRATRAFDKVMAEAIRRHGTDRRSTNVACSTPSCRWSSEMRLRHGVTRRAGRRR